MRMSDVLLFGPPVLLGVFIWAVSEYAIRSGRRFKAQLARNDAVRAGRSHPNP